MMPLTIRRATVVDAGLVRDITRAAYAEWVPLIGREPKPMTADYAHAVVAHIVDLGLAGDGRPVGLIEVVPEPTCLLIENIAVLPEARGTGAGGALLAHAEGIARGLGLADVRLYTNAAFAANIAFYARRGFAEVRRETIPGAGTAVHMTKRLS